MPFRLASVLAVLLAACAQPGSSSDEATPFAHAIRSLRASAVGDRRFADSREGARATRHGASPAKSRAVPRARSAPRDPALLGPDVPSVVIRFTTVTAPPHALWMGDTVAFLPPAPPTGTPDVIARDLRWTSTEPAVATVSAGGIVVAHQPGAATIVAWRRVGETLTPVTVLPAARGRIIAANEGPVRARVVVEAAGWIDTAWTDANGAFVLRAPRDLAGTATVRVEPSPADAQPIAGHAASGHAPALLANVPIARLADLDVVLLPTRWHIAAGSYAGTSVPIFPAIAQGRARDGRRYWRVSQPGRAVGWSAARLPLAVAFASDRAVGAADSAAFWRIARQLERDWGAPIFRPADRAAAAAEDFRGIVVAVDPRLGSAGLTTASWAGDGDVSEATVAVRARSLLADPVVVTHELMHALGIGHASDGWTSVMHPTAGAGTPARASVEDIAYGQLLYAVRARARGTGTPMGIAEAAAAAR